MPIAKIIYSLANQPELRRERATARRPKAEPETTGSKTGSSPPHEQPERKPPPASVG